MFDLLIPMILCVVASWGVMNRVDVYGALVKGAGQGIEIVVRILPALVALMTAVSMLRASGALEMAAEGMAPILEKVGIPPQLLTLILVRPLSGSAALGVGAELMAEYGPDSELGRMAAVMLGSTETTFYTIAVYLGAVGMNKSGYVVPAALCADVTGFLAAAWAVRMFY